MQNFLIKDVFVFVVGVLWVLLKNPFWKDFEYTMFVLTPPWTIITPLEIGILNFDLKIFSFSYYNNYQYHCPCLGAPMMKLVQFREVPSQDMSSIPRPILTT